MNRSFVTRFGFVSLVALLLACETESTPAPNPTTPGADAGESDANPPANDGGTDGPVKVDCPVPTGGPTMHKYDVMGEETWTAAGSPHIVEYDVSVRKARSSPSSRAPKCG